MVATCGKCHEGSNRQFAGYLTHATHHDRTQVPVALLVVPLHDGAARRHALLRAAHTAAWLVRLFLSREQWQHIKDRSRLEGHEKLYRRFTWFQRAQHLFMMLSFFTLALTGMALKFSYAGWAQVISDLLGGQPAMGVLHRLGALVLIAVFAVHVLDVRRKQARGGRTWKRAADRAGHDPLPRRATCSDVIGSIKWFLGLGPRPYYGRYTYWEKFDYFAVFWGVMVIGSTGFVLWFPELLTRVLPGCGDQRRDHRPQRRSAARGRASSSPSTSSTRTSGRTSSRWTRSSSPAG